MALGLGQIMAKALDKKQIIQAVKNSDVLAEMLLKELVGSVPPEQLLKGVSSTLIAKTALESEKLSSALVTYLASSKNKSRGRSGRYASLGNPQQAALKEKLVRACKGGITREQLDKVIGKGTDQNNAIDWTKRHKVVRFENGRYWSAGVRALKKVVKR